MKRVLKELQLSAIAAVDRPCQEGALAMIMKRDRSDKKQLAKEKSEQPDMVDRIVKRFLDEEDFEKAFAGVVDCLTDCEAPEQLIQKFKGHKDAIAEIIGDEKLSALGKHEELRDGLEPLFSDADFAKKLEESLETGDRLRALKSRADALMSKATAGDKLQSMAARIGKLNANLRKVS